MEPEMDEEDDGLMKRLALILELVESAVAKERERCAKIAENYSNAKPGDICEVMAGHWQAEIAAAIRRSDGQSAE